MRSGKELRAIAEHADACFAEFSATRGKLLAAVAELEASESYRFDGAVEFAAWLAARWQIGIRTAREIVRDADAMKDRPELSEALCEGAVSADQVKAITTISPEPNADGAWLENLPAWTITELEREARKVKAATLTGKDGGEYLRMRASDDERFMRGDFQLRWEDGAALLAEIESRIPKGTKLRNWDRASARALVELMKDHSSASSARPLLLVSTDAAVLDGSDDGTAALGKGGAVAHIAAETARRLACDGTIQLVYKDQDTITAVGRSSPGVSPGMRRLVEDRDGGVCANPSCERDAYLEVHHIIPREEGGPTVLCNLLLLCWDHHEDLHEGGWSVRGDAGPNMTWVRPDGTIYEPRVRITLDTS
jgi:hypothetical protein